MRNASIRDRLSGFPLMARIGAVGLVVAIFTVACGGPAADEVGQTSQPRQASTTTWYSIAEKAALFVACFQERGFQAELYEEIGIMMDLGDQPEAAQRAENECWDEIDARYPDPPRLSDREAYDALLEAAECLRAEGIAVSDPPTFEAWADSRNAPVSEDGLGQPQWHPHSEIPVSADFWALHRRCPQPGLGLTPEGGGTP